MTGDYIFSRTFPFLRTCSLCGAKRRTLYEVPLGDMIYLFCNTMEVEEGMKNFEKNKHILNIQSDAIPVRSEDASEIVRTSGDDGI